MLSLGKEDRDALERIAQAYINGYVSGEAIRGLDIIDLWYVLTLASIYSCTRIGTMSQKECVKFKDKVAHEYANFSKLMWNEKVSHLNFINQIKNHSGNGTEIAKEMAKDKPDAEKIFIMLFELLDIITRENIMSKLFRGKLENPEFKADCQRAIIKNIDKVDELLAATSYRDEDLINVLSDFFKATDELEVSKLYSFLSDDEIKKSVRKNIPLKKDDCRAIAQNIRSIYGGDEYQRREGQRNVFQTENGEQGADRGEQKPDNPAC